MRASAALSSGGWAEKADRVQLVRRAQARGWLWPVSVVLLALGSCIVRWPYLDVPISPDEGGYATAAYWWARGDMLYRDITITRPQGIFVVFRLIEALGLGSVRGIHLFSAGYTALSTLALLAVAGRVWGRAIGLGAAALFALVMATPFLDGYGANAEVFMTLPLLGSLYLLLRADDCALGSWRGGWFLVGVGVLGALALLLKPSGIAALPLAGLWLLRRRQTERAPWGAWLRAELVLGLSFLAGLLPALLHGMLTAPDRYLDAVLFYRLHQDSLAGAAAGYRYQLHSLTINTLWMFSHLPILTLFVGGLWAVRRSEERRGRDLLWLWLLTALGGIALGGNWFLHYYQQALPPLAVAVALGIRALPRGVQHGARAALQCLAGVGVAALALVLVWTAINRGAPAALVADYEPVMSAAAPVAAYLRDHTAPEDTIYVLYDHADIYYLAQRRPAARWLHYRELGWTPGAFDEQLTRLGDPATAPRYIVGAQDFGRWGFDADGRMRALVSREYTLETTIGGVPVYRRKG